MDEDLHDPCRVRIAALEAEVIYLRKSFDTLTTGINAFVQRWREDVLGRPLPGQDPVEG